MVSLPYGTPPEEVSQMQHDLPTAVTAELSLRMVVDADRTVEVPCTMEYRADEPYAVYATFHTGVADIGWVFARDLLVEGMQRPSGDGDIVISPEWHGRVPQVVLALNSPSGLAVMECDRSHIEVFLRHTYGIVAVGEESASLDVDGCIEAILREGVQEV